MGNSFYNYKSRDELKSVLAVSRGDQEADVVLKGANILDVVNGEFFQADIALSGRLIAGVGQYCSSNEIDYSGKYIVPGFINSHLHIESSLMHPFEFQNSTLPMGTTTAICDPHEITNVMGKKGIEWFLRCASQMHQNLFVQISSCVPALPGMETNGASFELPEMERFIGQNHTLGMAEMMNFPAVINGIDPILDKMERFQKAGMGVDGHAPLMRGKTLDGYVSAGVRNCHETVLLDEAKEKLRKGMAVMIREGSVAKNLKTLAPIINEMNSINTLLCTDDRNPYDLFEEGELTYMLKVLMNEFDIRPEVAYRMASYSSANHFRLDHLGMIAPGKQADLVILDDLKEVSIVETYIKGQAVSGINLKSASQKGFENSNPPLKNSIQRKPVAKEQFSKEYPNGTYPYIQIIPNEIVTKYQETIVTDGSFDRDDILKLAVIERYGHEQPISLGLVQGFGLKNGAIASSVAHDSHNLIVVGDNESDMEVATNTLIGCGGGFCVVQSGKVLSKLELPIAGLMSVKSASEIHEEIIALKESLESINCILDEPFLQLAFLALPVIPELKLTDQGLFDVRSFKYIE
jgi:adenine deaminase